ncbi:MAG: hypothetical protein IJ859_03140 [Synergistaceae bacterium]|nr:hypothetical protein [Synergistaceae bacterium]
MPEKSKRACKDPIAKVNQSFTQVRIDEETFAKGKILAAIYGESFNHLMVEAIKNEIQKYEVENGPLPKPVAKA